jgi:DNA-directed RNA polymerase specialized sigma24 family protein
MSSADSVTHWIEQIKAGDPAAAEPLWERYYQRLVGLAGAKLRDRPGRAAGASDVALSAFDSFCRGAAQGRFPLLSDRDNLWPLLLKITERKAIDLIQHDNRIRRGGGKVRGESALPDVEDGQGERGIEQVPAPDPSPDSVVAVAEGMQCLLDCLKTDKLRSIALWKLEGYTNEEIALKFRCAERTVERKLNMIRGYWEKEAPRG